MLDEEDWRRFPLMIIAIIIVMFYSFSAVVFELWYESVSAVRSTASPSPLHPSNPQVSPEPIQPTEGLQPPPAQSTSCETTEKTQEETTSLLVSLAGRTVQPERRTVASHRSETGFKVRAEAAEAFWGISKAEKTAGFANETIVGLFSNKRIVFVPKPLVVFLAFVIHKKPAKPRWKDL